MSKDPTPAMRMVKLNPDIHEKVNKIAEWLGVEPGEVVEEAVAFYLDSNRDELSDRIQTRVAELFDKAAAKAPKMAQPVGWGGAPGGWSLKSEIWGAKDES